MLKNTSRTETLGSALRNLEDIAERARGRRLALFLDYDGTLTPIVSRPEDALLSNGMRETLRRVAGRWPVAVISGRDLEDVRALVGLEEIYYAGSHGFDIAGPRGVRLESEPGVKFLPVLDSAEERLTALLHSFDGVQVERKRFSIAIHYRRAREEHVEEVKRVVTEVKGDNPSLRMNYGKKVYELQPEIDWNKGKALLWLLAELHLDEPDVLPLYLGDDITDEDAFEVLRSRGIGIIVRDEPRETAAHYALDDTAEVRTFLEALTSPDIGDSTQ